MRPQRCLTVVKSVENTVGVCGSSDKFLWHGGDSSEKKEGKLERRQWGRGGRDAEAVLVSGVKGARSTVTVSSEKKRLGVEGRADRWGPPIGVKRKRKRKKERRAERGGAG
jgi:hypothetical protein